MDTAAGRPKDDVSLPKGTKLVFTLTAGWFGGCFVIIYLYYVVFDQRNCFFCGFIRKVAQRF